MTQARVYGYVRASLDPQIEGPDEQKKLIEAYCERADLGLHGFYVDPAAGGRLPLHRRVAGGRLTQDLRKGDHAIASRVDRLADSFFEAVFVLDSWYRRGVTTHLLDVPGGRLDADSPHTFRLIEALNSFVRAGRRMVGVRVRESFAQLKLEGRRRSGHAPFGSRWERRGGKTYMVPAPEERAICRRVAELYAEGFSYDQIRRYLAYEWKVRNRNGKEFGYSEIRNMVSRGVELLVSAASSPSTTLPDPIPPGAC
jgi:DNA invertase Pin-like site-specific DNA recombinase